MSVTFLEAEDKPYLEIASCLNVNSNLQSALTSITGNELQLDVLTWELHVVDEF